MATTTLLIPRVIARQLTEIAQLGKFSVFPATPKCSHWAVYDSHKTELACPCAPLEPDAKLLIRTMAAILQENFVPRSEPCETPFSRADTTQQIKDTKSQKTDYHTSAEIHQRTEDTNPQKQQTSQPIPTPPHPTPIAPRPAVAEAQQRNHPNITRPIPQPPSSPLPKLAEVSKAEPKTPTGPIPSPTALAGKFKPLTYKPPAIAEYYATKPSRGARHGEAAEERVWPLKEVEAIAPYTVSQEKHTDLLDTERLSKTLGDQYYLRGTKRDSLLRRLHKTQHRAVPHPEASGSKYPEIRPEMLKHIKELNLDYEDIKRFIDCGVPEKINGWTTHYRYDDYRVELNTSSNTVLNVEDERDFYDEFLDDTSEEELPYTFAPAVEHYMVMHSIPYNRVIHIIEEPKSVDPAPSWLTAYSDHEYRVFVAPDGRTIRSIKPLKED